MANTGIEQKAQGVYGTRVVFRKIIEEGIVVKRVVSVYIRDTKRGRTKIRTFPFPRDIKDSDLIWRGFEGEMIAVYHKTGASEYRLRYKNEHHEYTNTAFTQKLDDLVLNALEKP